MPPKARATWTTGTPTINVDAAGTMVASVPVLDAGKLAATIRYTLTADRALRIDVLNAPGAAGLTGFEAWSDL